MAENLHRRQYVRTTVALPVKFTVEKDAAAHEGLVVDLGEGGMRLVSSSHAPARSTVSLTFTLPGEPRPVKARGHVVLSFYAAPELKYHHGIAFISIDREDRNAIGQFVEAQVAR
jgi:c-di-GMP-binding flagellar brake protein YcgR